MTILGIDPGAKPGYAIRFIDGETITFPSWKTLREHPKSGRLLTANAIVTEGVWIAPKTAKGKAAPPLKIAKLSRTAGRQIQRASTILGLPVFVLPVHIWKNACMYNGGKVPKDVFVKRLRYILPLGANVPEDQVEAAGIAMAFELLGGRAGCSEFLEPEPK